MQYEFNDVARIPDRKPRNVTIHLNPIDFFNECLLKSKLIKNKDDRKQFMDWAIHFKDGVKKFDPTDLELGLKDMQGLQNNRYFKPSYRYYIFTAIIFDGVDAVTCIEEDGSITLSKGELLFGKYDDPDDIYPHEVWARVANASPYAMLDIIVDQYNNVDNRYKCRIHGEIYYKRHNGKWTKK